MPTPADWTAKLHSAQGDDAALLALSRESAPLELRLAAVGALASEAALKQAERELRNHDRRLHRLAKQRHAALVARRLAAEQASRLVAAAQALLDEPQIAVNRLVELDRGWQALDADLLDAPERERFESLRARLAMLTRERADKALELKRWTAQAQRALVELRAACSEAAAGTQPRSGLAAPRAAAQHAIEGAPPGDGVTTLRDALAEACRNCDQLDERLAVFDTLPGTVPAEDTELPSPAPALDDGAEPATVPPDPVLRWQQLAPLDDAGLAGLLDRRFEQWQRSRHEAQQARVAQRREQAMARQQAMRHERTENLAEVLARAEAALADGHPAATHRHLVRIDELLHGGASAGALRSRIDALQAGYAQLKGWQHWAGGRARDELVLQAEALAAATAGPPDKATVKLSTRQRAELIDDLRGRWKELDRLGGATSRSLWQRFDAALEVAYQPVAAQVAAQRAARQQNLQARQQLLSALEATALPEPGEGPAAPDWRAVAVALDHFLSAWHKLGPLEHTVPHKSRGALVERMTAAVARLEGPLHDARRQARLGREQLIERARELAAAAGTGAHGRDLVDRVRALQAEWQQQARALPLARADENALWAEFKAAVDGCFSARKAFFDARDAESRAQGAERLALIGRLEALAVDAAPAEVRRTLAEVEAEWHRGRPASRHDAAALEARFARARDAAHAALARAAQDRWHATCDALAAKLALCEEFEQAGATAAAPVVAQRWAALPALPTAWEQALAERIGLAGAAVAGLTPRAESTDDLLLQAEAAWGLASPPDFEAARRQLKLQAMKAALEGRRVAAAGILTPELALLTLLRRKGLDATQRERLGAVLQAIRQRGPADALPKPASTAAR